MVVTRDVVNFAIVIDASSEAHPAKSAAQQTPPEREAQ
jgi:hypothetical protein